MHRNAQESGVNEFIGTSRGLALSRTLAVAEMTAFGVIRSAGRQDPKPADNTNGDEAQFGESKCCKTSNVILPKTRLSRKDCEHEEGEKERVPRPVWIKTGS